MISRNTSETSPVPTEPRTLAERLRYLRKMRGLTQVELSEALGCEQALISSWEVGRTKPSAVSMGALARFYQFTLLALETGEGFMLEAQRLQKAAQQAGRAADDAAGELPVQLPPSPAGILTLVDTASGLAEARDTADAMAMLLRALKKGRRAWIVLK